MMPLFITDISWLKYIFVMGGLVYALYTMTMNGLLLEISGNENRALYTGFAGAGNILPALFPLVGGTIIQVFGFSAFFVLFMVVVSLAAFFIFKIDCKSWKYLSSPKIAQAAISWQNMVSPTSSKLMVKKFYLTPVIPMFFWKMRKNWEWIFIMKLKKLYWVTVTGIILTDWNTSKTKR